MSGRSAWRKDYTPYLLDFPHISQHRADELERVIRQVGAEYISAFIVEPILGTSAAGLATAGRLLPHGEGTYAITTGFS